MNKIIKYYLYVIPLYSLVSIYLATIRITSAANYGELMLTISFFMDVVIIAAGHRKARHPIVIGVSLLLLVSLVVGLLNENNISRRYITDFTNPLFFFAKIYIFAFYWSKNDFVKYANYYKKTAFWGSLLFLPFTYFLFISSGSTRIAIFPPLELVMPTLLVNNQILFALVCFLMIILYGKRAQMIGALIGALTFVFLFKRKNFLKVLIVGGFIGITIYLVLTFFSENLAVQRILYTFELLDEAESGSQVETVTGSRYYEVTSILKEMYSWYDFLLGKGLGFEYILDGETIQESKVHSNAHFSPIALLSKYGLIFTVFTYFFIFSLFRTTKYKDKGFQIAIITVLFLLTESLFAYVFFVVPIFPIALGYLVYLKKQ